MSIDPYLHFSNKQYLFDILKTSENDTEPLDIDIYLDDTIKDILYKITIKNENISDNFIYLWMNDNNTNYPLINSYDNINMNNIFLENDYDNRFVTEDNTKINNSYINQLNITLESFLKNNNIRNNKIYFSLINDSQVNNEKIYYGIITKYFPLLSMIEELQDS
jgi:hypothetical protein